MIVDNLDIGIPAAVSCGSGKTFPLLSDDFSSYVNYVVTNIRIPFKTNVRVSFCTFH